MKNKLIIVIGIIFLLSIIGCSNEKSIKNTSDTKTNIETSNSVSSNIGVEENKSEQNTSAPVKVEGVKCGETFKYGDLSYNVIGVRTNEYGNGVKYLIIKIEVFNSGSSDVNFTAMERLTLLGNDGTEYSLDLFADVDSRLEGMITPENKIMGEVAFDITDSKKDGYLLKIGEFYDNYKSAISITENDIDKTFAEQFEGKGIVSDYTIGTPVESAQFTIILDGAAITPSKKEGKEIVSCNFTIVNNTSENQSFLVDFYMSGYSADGGKLDLKAGDITVPVDIGANETVRGVIPYTIYAGTRDFYVTVTPDISKRNEKVNVVFSAE